MQLNARIQAVIEMFDIFLSSLAPFDIIMARFFRNNKWIGSSDRREIAEFSYAIFRSFEKLKFLTSNITANFSRFYVLAFLNIEKELSVEKISEIFCGKPYTPSKLTEFELHFLNSLNCNKKFPQNALLNYLEWMEPYLKRAFSLDDMENEMFALNQKAPLDLRVNTLKSSRDEVRKMLIDSGFQIEDAKISKNGLRILKGRIGRDHDVISQGLAEIQDEGSQLIAEICETCSEDTVVDFCAGAGGKTLAIAAMMNNKGRIFAADRDEKRLEKAKLRFRKAGVNNVFCQTTTNKWLKRHLECADVVLVDAPCSGTGTWRRNPDMRAKFMQEDLEELIIVQEEILESARRLVKKGGKLVYATCSILKEENQDQIAKFLNKFEEFKLSDVKLQSYSGQFLQLTPYKNQTDGFFGAILKKSL